MSVAPNDDGLKCSACWSAFGASLPFVCVVTCLRRCGAYRLNSTPQTLDHGSTTLIYDASQPALARLEENTRAIPNIVSLSPYSSQDSFTSLGAALHPSCRRDTDDTDDVMVGMHDSTMHGAVPFPKRSCV